MKRWLGWAVFAVAALVVFQVAMTVIGGGGSLLAPSTTLRIVSGSENRTLEPIVTEWAADSGYGVEVEYLGSVDISRELQRGTEGGYDAVWPAHSLWIELGDQDRVVKHDQSILRSPVALGLKRSIAARLGWIGREDVTIQDIAEAALAGEFRLAMTSATQSNSGASAYFGFLYAMAGDPDVLTLDHLADPAVRGRVGDLLSAVDRSSGSSGWLGDAFIANPDRFDAMFNYEAVLIEANQAFAAAGGETLYFVYPANGLAVADSPLGYVDKGDAEKEAAFLALQEHLLAPETQNELLDRGRRAGLLGLDVAAADPSVWNPEWGVDLTRAIAPIPTPAQPVIREALTLYQTELRKPSLTVWVLDTSGSMEGEPIAQLKEAMALLLDPEQAALNLLQPSARDVTIVIPFNSDVERISVVEGAETADLRRLLVDVLRLRAGGGTDLYFALMAALRQLADYEGRGELFDYLPAIVAMTDGASDEGRRREFLRALENLPFGRDVPIHAIAFGQADEAQLEELNRVTVGRLFRAGDDLADALRSAKGYN